MKKIFSPVFATVAVLCCAACNNAPKSSECACENGLDVVHIQEPVLVEVDNPQVDLSTLTKDADGYYSLFNGKTLDGWRGFCKDHMPSRWVVENGAVSHWQNDVEVVKYQLWTPEWEAMLRDCKWAPEKSPVAFACFMNCGGASKTGYIGFQDHGDVVWYKNIKVKEL